MKKYLFLLAAAATITACSNDDEQSSSVAVADDNISFVIDVPGMTRATNDGTMRSADGNFYIWADQVEQVNESSVLHEGFINAWQMETADDASKLKTTGSTYKWPAVNRLRFYAIHGNFSGTNSTITNNVSPFPKATLTEEEAAVAENLGPLTHTVSTIQTTSNAGNMNYQQSDLLYAVLPTTGIVQPVPLHFYHLMSKVVIKIVKGEGITLDELNGATVKIVKVKNKVNFMPKKLSLTSTQTSGLLKNDVSELTTYATRTETLASMLSLPAQDLVDIDVSTTVNETASGTKTEAAIIVPQEFDAENTTSGIQIMWSGKTITVPFRVNFEAGKQYTYNITLNHVGTSYGFSPTVSSWGEEEERAIDVKSGS